MIYFSVFGNDCKESSCHVEHGGWVYVACCGYCRCRRHCKSREGLFMFFVSTPNSKSVREIYHGGSFALFNSKNLHYFKKISKSFQSFLWENFHKCCDRSTVNHSSARRCPSNWCTRDIGLSLGFGLRRLYPNTNLSISGGFSDCLSSIKHRNRQIMTSVTCNKEISLRWAIFEWRDPATIGRHYKS